ncbi:unnamed protein product [Camellia sinensis]
MVAIMAPIKISMKDKKKEERKETHPSLKELQEKKYPFPDSDIPGMLKDLLEKKVIQLPECKRPEEIGRVKDSKYCHYHWIVSHSSEKCFVLKELLVDLARKNKILLDLDKSAESNHATVIVGPPNSPSSKSKTEMSQSIIPTVKAIPKVIQFEVLTIEEDKSWTPVTRRKSKKSKSKTQHFSLKKVEEKKNSTRHSKKEVMDKRKNEKRMQQVDKFLEENSSTLIILRDFVPIGYFGDDLVEVACMVLTVEADVEQVHAIKAMPDKKEIDVLTTLKELPPRFSLREASQLPRFVQLALVRVLEDLRKYEFVVNELDYPEVNSITSVPCCTTVTFTNEDLQLGSKPHNRPLFVSGFISEQKVKCILVDRGLAVNIMPKFTIKKLGIPVDELARSHLVIQGFNQGDQRAIGMIHLNLTIGELTASTLFHVINARTSYNLLLRLPWIHGNGVVVSTLHQCFKFDQGGIKTVLADNKPFTETESVITRPSYMVS